MNKGFFTEEDQKLALRLFAKRIKTLDERFDTFLKSTGALSEPINSFGEMIELKTEIFNEYTMTEMKFRLPVKLPYEIKMAIIDEFSAIFRN